MRSVSVRTDRGPAIASHVLHPGEMILHIQHIPHPALEPFAKLVTLKDLMQGFAADPVYVKGEVFAYVGLPQNLKDLKDLNHHSSPDSMRASSHDFSL